MLLVNGACMGIIAGNIVIYTGIYKKLYRWSSTLFCHHCLYFTKLQKITKLKKMIHSARCFSKEEKIWARKNTLFKKMVFFSRIQACKAIYNAAPKTSDVSWMDGTILSNSKVSECKSGLFEHAQSISK